MKIERWFVSFLILLVSVSMSLLSRSPVYRTLPLIFGVASLTGYILKSTFIFDTGIFLTIISYLFANGGLSITFYNLIMILTFFFLIMGIWFYGRNTLLISGIEGLGGDISDIGLSEFRRSLVNDIISTHLTGALLSILALLLVLYSSLGIVMGSMLETLLMVILSGVVFFAMFLMIVLLSSQRIRIGDES